MNSRRNYAKRNKYYLDQYAFYYAATNDKDMAIDTLDLVSLATSLLRIKYEFNTTDELIKFATTLLKFMGIDDDKKHYITPRNIPLYDMIVTTTGKTPVEIKDEILMRLTLQVLKKLKKLKKSKKSKGLKRSKGLKKSSKIHKTTK